MPSSAFLPVERVSGARPIIDPSHDAIHDGRHFTVTHSVSVGTATAVSILFQTPSALSGNYIHFTCSIESDKGVDWTFSKVPNASGGSALVAYNNDENSANTNPMQSLTHTATYVSAGTILESHIMGTNQPSTKLGGDAEARNEWVLTPDRFYLIRAVALAADTKINVVIPFYYREQ